MSWFPIPHSLFSENTRFKRLSFAEKGRYFHLCYLASKAIPRGLIREDDEDVAYELSMDVADWRTFKAKLRVRGLIDFQPNGITLVAWSAETSVDAGLDRRGKGAYPLHLLPPTLEGETTVLELESVQYERSRAVVPHPQPPSGFIDKTKWLMAYNGHRPENWRSCRVVAPELERRIQILITVCGSEAEAISVLTLALQGIRIEDQGFYRQVRWSLATLLDPAHLNQRVLDIAADAQEQGLNPDAIAASGLTEADLSLARYAQWKRNKMALKDKGKRDA